MKKNYMAPVMEIEIVKMTKNLMLTVSPGDPVGDDETVTADTKQFSDEYSLDGKYLWE